MVEVEFYKEEIKNKLYKNILVTGGAGFIGSNIVEILLSSGVKSVRIMDNLITGKMDNIQFLLDKYENVEFLRGDISNIEDCRKAMLGIDLICHQAALGSVPRSVNDPLSSHISNVNGFLNILLAAKEKGLKRIVYASSSSVYGDDCKLPKVEKNIGNVLSPYAATKKIDEIYAGVFTKCYDMECIGLRYFNIFGPRQDPNGAYAAVIPKFINLIKQNKKPTINGDGSFSRDFTYVQNAVQANILALTTENKKCFGEAFNIGCGGQYTLNELVKHINNGLGKNIVPLNGPNRAGDIPHSNADISKARDMLGYEALINFKDGINKLIKYIHFNKVEVITVAKVGSCNFLKCKYSKTKNVKHGHSLLKLKNVLKEESNCLIVVGIRNPIERNLSWLFQSFNGKIYTDVKTKKNNYKGEYCYIPGMSSDEDTIWRNSHIKINFSAEKIIDSYFKQKYHNTFNDWFEEFLEITKITTFDKDKGISFYNLKNNNTIMIYTLEKLNENKKYICDKLGITFLGHQNNSKERGYCKIYQEVKEKIVYKKEYLNNLLDTKIMKLFYNDSDIKLFYSKYKTL